MLFRVLPCGLSALLLLDRCAAYSLIRERRRKTDKTENGVVTYVNNCRWQANKETWKGKARENCGVGGKAETGSDRAALSVRLACTLLQTDGYRDDICFAILFYTL